MTIPVVVNGLTVTAAVASAQLGGTERVLLDLAEHAPTLGIRLSVIAPADGPLLERLADLDVPWTVVPQPKRLLRGSQQQGHLGSLPGALVGLISWSSRLGNEPMLRQADVVYTVGFKTHVAVGLTHERPLVWHLHEFPPARTGGVWRFLARHVPDAVITNSVAVHRSWFRGRANGSSHVVLNGVDLQRFRPRKPTGWIHRALGLPDNARLVGMPAVLARWKGHNEVIAAFRQIQERFPDAHLVLVGSAIYDTAGSAAIETEIRSALEGSTRIHMLPFQDEVERVYPEFTLTVHYSLRPEPFGRVILESLSCGVPVVAAAEGGPLEILQTQNTEGSIWKARQGWLVQPRAPSSLANALESALSLPPEDKEALGRAARARAERAFSAGTFARGVSDVLWSVKRTL